MRVEKRRKMVECKLQSAAQTLSATRLWGLEFWYDKCRK